MLLEENKEYIQIKDEQSVFVWQDVISNIMKNMKKTNQELAKIEEQIKQIQHAFIIPELSNILSNFNKIGSVFLATMNSDAIKSFGEMALKLQSYKIDIGKFNFLQYSSDILKIQIPEGLKKFAKEYTYLKNLEKIGWPLFVYNNDELKNRLIECFNSFDDDVTYNIDVINDVIFEEITDNDVLRLGYSWEDSSVISVNRIQILREAVDLYKQGYYYGCVSILMCQLEGIITDIYVMHSNFGIEYTGEEAKMAYEHYTHKVLEGKIKLDREKNQLLCMMTKIENGFFYWIFVIGYIYTILLTSKEEMNQSSHPCRNKVCHGIQTNFGTKEHALKAILSIDMLINFAEEMRRVVESSEIN